MTKEKLAAPVPGSKIVVEKDWIVEISLGKFFFLIVFYAKYFRF
jgi:hypothetical protein